jgi:hypothetical protein
MPLFNRIPHHICIIKSTLSDKHVKEGIQIFRMEKTGSNEQTAVTLVSLWILLEYKSVEDNIITNV